MYFALKGLQSIASIVTTVNEVACVTMTKNFEVTKISTMQTGKSPLTTVERVGFYAHDVYLGH